MNISDKISSIKTIENFNLKYSFIFFKIRWRFVGFLEYILIVWYYNYDLIKRTQRNVLSFPQWMLNS